MTTRVVGSATVELEPARLGCLHDVSPGFAELFGQARLQHLSDPGNPSAGVARLLALRSGRSSGFDVEVGLGGRWIELTVTTAVVDAVPRRWAHVQARDVSDRKDAARRFARAHVELRRSNAELAHHAAAAAHDVARPLRAVRRHAEALAQELGPDADTSVHDALAELLAAVEETDALLHDTVAQARPSTVVERVSMTAIVERAVDCLAAEIGAGGSRVHVEPLPDVLGDEGRLTRVVMNLLANALAYRGDAPARVAISATREPGRWRFTVADAGIGIAADEAERIFGTFVRAQRTEMLPGSGLGLAICRSMVRWHGGEIWAEGAPGRGSAFHFTIPDPIDGADS